MKRAGFLIEKIAETDNLLLAFHKAMRGNRQSKEAIAFSASLDANLMQLRDELLAGSPVVGAYTYFHILDPKPRLICAAAFRERVLHHAIMNVCHPYFERQLIETTYATRPGKGIYKALDRARRAARKYRYVAKFDFRKYFDSIDHGILKAKLRRIFKDRRLLQVFDSIIDSYSRAEGKGLPIGNLTSQYFANFYLSEMDHRCKEVLHIGEYVRYMDDFLVFADTPEQLAEYVSQIGEFAAGSLKLTLKPVVAHKVSRGIAFLGYKVYPHKVLLTARSKRRFCKKFSLYGKRLQSQEWTEKAYYEHITPLMAFARYAYTKRLRNRLLRESAGSTSLPASPWQNRKR